MQLLGERNMLHSYHEESSSQPITNSHGHTRVHKHIMAEQSLQPHLTTHTAKDLSNGPVENNYSGQSGPFCCLGLWSAEEGVVCVCGRRVGGASGVGVGLCYGRWSGRKHVTNLNSSLLHLFSGVHVVEFSGGWERVGGSFSTAFLI